MTKQMNVPKLRFDEFDSCISMRPISEVIKSYRLGGNYGNTMVPNSNPLMKMGNLGRGDFNLNKVEYIDSENLIAEDDEMKYGDLFFNTRNTLELVGKVAIWRKELPRAFYNSNLLRLEFDNNFYFNYVFNSPPRIKALRRVATGTTSVAAVYTRDLLKILVPTPCTKEQQKIASFLSKVDEKIALLTEKKDKLIEYKKGVMQQLFNGKWQDKDGQLIFIPPTLRFKADDGSEFPDWKEKKFGDCFDFFTTNSLSRDKLSYDMGMIKNIHYGDIHTKFRSIFKPEQELVPYIAELDDTKKIKPQSYCQNGDLVFADASEDYADIGKCIEVRELGNLKLVAGLHTHLARPKEKFATGYQAYLQKSWKMRYQIMRIAQGTKVLGISTKQLATIYLPVPCYEEQEKIAAFLTSLDSKIECLEFELNKSKEWKKGLLQQMFV